ncbi:hypothetical protein HMPREF0972_01863 [Actinomyces sp. oral taxon 848 str. F0332]|nr:hypothetical protein HMPREF0972_01863 [Actinomyces sp. oral taxon 848 str. F0332]
MNRSSHESPTLFGRSSPPPGRRQADAVRDPLDGTVAFSPEAACRSASRTALAPRAPSIQSAREGTQPRSSGAGARTDAGPEPDVRTKSSVGSEPDDENEPDIQTGPQASIG